MLLTTDVQVCRDNATHTLRNALATDWLRYQNMLYRHDTVAVKSLDYLLPE